MKSEQIIDKIIAAKNEAGLTNQQLADLSGVPKSTVDKIMRKETTNPSLQNVLDLAAAVGYDHARTEEADPLAAPSVKYVLAMHNRHEAEKDRRIYTLSVLVIVLALTLFLVLVAVAWVWHYDFTNLDRGWIQAAAGYGAAAVDSVRQIFA